MYLGQEPLPLDAPQPRVILHLAGDAHDNQDLQLSRMGYRLTARLTLGPVVLVRRCILHIHTTSYSAFGFLLHIHTIPTLLYYFLLCVRVPTVPCSLSFKKLALFQELLTNILQLAL